MPAGRIEVEEGVGGGGGEEMEGREGGKKSTSSKKFNNIPLVVLRMPLTRRPCIVQ